MRLIDADEAVKRIASVARIAKSDKQQALIGRCIYIIENCPTVDSEHVRNRRMSKEFICPTNGEPCSECIPGAPCAIKKDVGA